MKNFKKGFTLIELLVVIAIIGILASVVLTSLISPSKKGRVAAFKKEISGVQKAFIIRCDNSSANSINAAWISANNVNALSPIAYKTFDKTVIPAPTQSCGSGSLYTFTTGLIPATNGITCSAVITESKVTYSGADCEVSGGVPNLDE